MLKQKNIILNTHIKINNNFCGTVVELDKGHSKIEFEPVEIMRSDEFGSVHSGFIFNSASFAAVACINEPNVVINSCSCVFFSSIRIGEIISFIAKDNTKEGKKRNVKVIGSLMELKIFEADFNIIITDNNNIKLDILNNIKEYDKK
jgi:acyl-coenzyme A thioesterase PaaI-like protein